MPCPCLVWQSTAARCAVLFCAGVWQLVRLTSSACYHRAPWHVHLWCSSCIIHHPSVTSCRSRPLVTKAAGSLTCSGTPPRWCAMQGHANSLRHVLIVFGACCHAVSCEGMTEHGLTYHNLSPPTLTTLPHADLCVCVCVCVLPGQHYQYSTLTYTAGIPCASSER